ncbi:MAG TPA: ATP-dependent 6-phosphofructokinase [Ktedonobacterales bacterium]|nr:ATP-dependent 6-phosphofructokinase [Ktedonobacterales bacterium]
MKLGVLTGGGDCPGLNPAIRAVVQRANQLGDEVIGILDGWKGLMEINSRPLGLEDVADILNVGGTLLGTSRTNPAKSPDGLERVKKNIEQLGLDALVAIGGDDTLGVANKLYQLGVKTVGVPKTMDNDINGADYCIGYETAVEIATEAIDRLQTTARSHHRVIVCEVMGREAGWVAATAGLAGGADYIIIPEVSTSMDKITEHLRKRRESGRTHSIIVVGEAAEVEGLGQLGVKTIDAFGHEILKERGLGEALASKIEEMTGMETRATVLGHIQRGGPPSAFDRVLGTRLGVAAIDLVHKGEFGKLPILHNGHIVTMNLAEAVGVNQKVDMDLYRVAEVFFT